MARKYRNLLFYVSTILVFGASIIGILRLGTALNPTAAPLSGHAIGPQASPGAQTLQPAGVTGPPAGVRGPLATLRDNLNHPLGILLIQLVAIIVAARGMGKLFRRMGQPSVIGEVVAGILLGPSLLGWISPDFHAFLFPKSSMANLQVLAQLGVILFMFIVGADLDLGHLRHKADAAVLVSHASIILPFFLGAAFSLLIFSMLAPAGIPFSAFALFMGVAMSITAFPVLARIVAERGLSKTTIGTTAIACAAVDDLTAWCLLAVVVAICKATGLMSALITISLALVFILGMLLVARPYTERVFGGADRRVGRVSGLLAFIFAAALFTETIGIHPLFGAFLAGAIMPSTEIIRKFVKSRLRTITAVVLLPLFFALTGLRTQIGLLSDWPSFLITAGLVAVAITGKFGGSTAAARWTGMNWHDSMSIGVLMNTRGLVQLVALDIGYELGILSPRLFTMMVLMALLTTFMAGPALSFLEWIKRRSTAAALQPAQSAIGT